MAESLSITVELYGELQRVCDGSVQQIDVADDADVAGVMRTLAQRYPDAHGVIARSACAMGDELVAGDTRLHDGQTLALIPPVSGG